MKSINHSKLDVLAEKFLNLPAIKSFYLKADILSRLKRDNFLFQVRYFFLQLQYFIVQLEYLIVLKKYFVLKFHIFLLKKQDTFKLVFRSFSYFVFHWIVLLRRGDKMNRLLPLIVLLCIIVQCFMSLGNNPFIPRININFSNFPTKSSCIFSTKNIFILDSTITISSC